MSLYIFHRPTICRLHQLHCYGYVGSNEFWKGAVLHCRHYAFRVDLHVVFESVSEVGEPKAPR